MGQQGQTGIFFLGISDTGQRSFPKEFKKGSLSRLEPGFAVILGCCAVFFFSLIGILSLKTPPVTISEKEITKIQERYARLVLNQPKPKIEKAEIKKETKEISREAPKVEQQEKKEEVKVDREKETFVEKQKRKVAGTEERKQKREEVAKQVKSSGIFAAITASGSGSGASVSASDLLGSATEEVADLSDLNISKGTFAAKKSDPVQIVKKKGSRTSDVNIQKENIGKTTVTQVASTAKVNITSQKPEVTGESASHSDRNQAAIGQVVSRETQRLKRVYEDWLKRDPALSGRLSVKFVILPSGSVSNVSIVKTTTGNPDFDGTILRYIRRWQFPPVPGGSSVEVVYPFVFEGQS